MVRVHTQNPNEPSFETGVHVHLGLALTPTFISTREHLSTRDILSTSLHSRDTTIL